MREPVDRSYSHVESLVDAMRALGLSNVHAEPVMASRWVRGPSTVRIEDGAELAAVSLGGSVATPGGGVSAEVLRVDSLEALEWTPDEKVRGRIVFFDNQTEVLRTRGPTRAARKGALAVLVRSSGDDVTLAGRTGMTQYEGDAKSAGATLTARRRVLRECAKP